MSIKTVSPNNALHAMRVSAGVRSLVIKLIGYFALMLAPIGTASANEPLLSCKDDVYVSYESPHTVSLKGRVAITKLTNRPKSVPEPTERSDSPYSPQQTAAFVLAAKQPESRNNVIHVFTVTGPLYAWRISFQDPRQNVTTKWINEDLIFLQVWWGRIVSTDLLFQLSSGTFIYEQEANYGSMVQPCK